MTAPLPLARRPNCTAAFLRAWAAAALVTGLPVTVVTAWVALESMTRWDTGFNWALAFAPLALTLTLGLVGLLLVALPLTHLLTAQHAESLRAYLLGGAIAGVVLGLVTAGPFGSLGDPEGASILVGMGLVGGLAGSFVWGRHRMRLQSWQQTDPRAPHAPAADRPSNPVHDLLY